jgi:hypothetical protein
VTGTAPDSASAISGRVSSSDGRLHGTGTVTDHGGGHGFRSSESDTDEVIPRRWTQRRRQGQPPTSGVAGTTPVLSNDVVAPGRPPRCSAEWRISPGFRSSRACESPQGGRPLTIEIQVIGRGHEHHGGLHVATTHRHRESHRGRRPCDPPRNGGEEPVEIPGGSGDSLGELGSREPQRRSRSDRPRPPPLLENRLWISQGGRRASSCARRCRCHRYRPR